MDLSFLVVKCRECGRVLRADVSKERQFGPGCALRMAEKWLNEHPKYLSIAARKRVSRKEAKQLALWFREWQIGKQSATDIPAITWRQKREQT